MENNWKFKTLENLEKDIWPILDSNEESHLIVTCNSLRKKILIDFSVEDLRIMIGQDIGLKFLIPISIEILKENIISEGDYYEGDLLNSVLSSDKKYWLSEKENHKTVCQIFQDNQQKLKDFDTTWEIKKKLFEAFKEFERYK
jgi:hypothetical protein